MNAPDIVFLNIKQRFRPGMSGDELYAAVRDAWKISEENRNSVQYAVAVAHAKVWGVWRVQKWEPVDESKWRFTGELADDLWVQCAGRRVRMSYGVQYGNLSEFLE